jgi:hypothetical protein
MTIRKRNDSEGWRRGEGAYTGSKPEPTQNLYERNDWNPDQAPTDPWSYPGNRRVPGDQDIKGRVIRERASGGEAAYSPDSDADWLRPDRTDDFQFSAGSRQIWRDTEENQDQNISSDPHNKITAGVSRSQSEGKKYDDRS